MSYQTVSKLDMLATYWQINLEVHVQEMMDFTCSYDVVQLLVMPSCLMNASAMFKWLENELLADLKFARVYADGVVIYYSSMIEHAVHITVVCKRTSWAGLKRKPGKCFFAKR